MGVSYQFYSWALEKILRRRWFQIFTEVGGVEQFHVYILIVTLGIRARYIDQLKNICAQYCRQDKLYLIGDHLTIGTVHRIYAI